jgi:dihydrofolate reductase
MQHDLIDQYQLLVYPIVLGGGKRLFKDLAKPINLKRLETRSFTTGVVLLSYEPERK